MFMYINIYCMRFNKLASKLERIESFRFYLHANALTYLKQIYITIYMQFVVELV